jgi:hypothetical protein
LEILLVNVATAGTYLFECKSYIDTFAFVHSGTFDVANPALNLLGSVDDANSDNWEFRFSINFSSAGTVILVVTTYSPSVTGQFLIVTTGPNKVTFTPLSITGKPITSSNSTTTTTTTPTTTTRVSSE